MSETAPQGWFRRLLGVIAPHKVSALIAFGSAWFGAGVVVLTPLAMRRLVDQSLANQRGALQTWSLVLLALAMIRAGLTFGRRWYGGRVSIEVEADLRRAVHDHLQTLDPATHDALSQGQVVSRANADVSMISGLLAFLPLLSSNLVILLLSLISMALLSPLLLLVVLAIIPPLAVLALQMRKWVYPASLAAQQQQAELANIADEAIVGVRVVKGFGQEEREVRRIEQASRQLYGNRMRNVRLTAKYAPAIQTIPSFGLVALLAVGGRFVLNGRISIGTFLAFATYLGQLIAPIRMAGIIVGALQSARAGAERVFEVLDYSPRIFDAPDAVDLPPGGGAIEFDNVSFHYLTNEPVLQSISLSIDPGETVAVVGSSGSGKSTLALFLPRFHDPVEGAVRVDGVDLRTVRLNSLRRDVGMVFDEAILFSSTVRENISYGRPEATNEEVREAAQQAEAIEFIEALPKGFDTVIGENGLTLSGGQRQRISLARALLTNPRILILDDATSALDVRTEAEIHRTMRNIMRTRTTLLIAHRRSTLSLASRIVVLDRGSVVDQGSYDELIERCQTFRLLLTGPGETAEGEGEAVTGPVVQRAVTAARQPGSASASLATSGSRAAVAPAPSFAPPPVGMGGGGMGPGMGGGGMVGGGIVPRQATIDRIKLLPPIVDFPDQTPDEAIQAAAKERPGLSLWASLARHRVWLGLGFGCVLLDAILGLAGPAIISAGLDGGIRGGSKRALDAAVLAFLAVAIVNLFVVRASSVAVGLVGERLMYNLRVRVFRHLQQLGLDFYEREMTGRILTRVTGDVDALTNLVQQGVVSLILNVLTFVGVAGFLLVKNFSLGLVSLAVMPLLLLATWQFRVSSSRAYGAVRERVAQVNASLAESFSGVRVVQAFGREGKNTSDFAGIVAAHRAARLQAQKAASLYFPVVELLGGIATTLVLWRGTKMVLDGRLTEAALLAFVLYLSQLFAPIQQLTVVLDTWQQATAASDKLRTLLNEGTSVPSAPQPQALPTGAEGVEIRFEDVSFQYQGTAELALEHISFTIPAGHTVALVGATGAGKSTFVKLIPRYYDVTSGSITVNGIDLRSVDLNEWRQQLGVVPQEAILFSGTIAENIAYGRPNATLDEVQAAARTVGAFDVIMGFPDGFDTIVANRGRTLSGGQRQLIALARAALVNPRVLLLDEATANLDLASEARVQEAMALLAAGRTTILIAHRLETVRRADEIVVIDQGRIVEKGTHEALVSLGGVYAELINSMQSSGH